MAPASKRMGSVGIKPKNSLIRDTFQACQDSVAVHPQLVKKLRQFYDSNDPDKFFESFIWYLRLPISGITERSVYIERTLDFVAKYACSFLEKEKETEENADTGAADQSAEKEDEELPLFIYRLFAWLLDHHEAEGSDVRLRVCQLLNKLLKYMGEEACIDDDLYNRIYDGMLERLKDKVPDIRSQAVTALQRLQDPRDENCPIIKAYLFHLAHDPNNIVRRTIVRCIGATRLTLPHILSRTRDVDEHVRRAAYKFLAEKVHIKSLTIGQREGVLQRGLRERSEGVRRVVEKEMIPSWLRLSDNNIVQLLHHLDVGNSDQEVKPGEQLSAPAGALEVVFSDHPYRDLVTNFQYLDPNKLIPYEKLTAETAMYWRVLAQYLDKEQGPGASEYLEQLMPELSQFCCYVRKYILELEKGDEDLNWEFVAKELIVMCSIYDLGDEVGRQNLCKLIKDLLISAKIPASFIPHLVNVFTKVEKNAQSRIEQVAEIISELKDPMSRDEIEMSPEVLSRSSVRVSKTATPTRAQLAANNKAIKEQEEAIRKKQLEIARVRLAMNQLRDELDSAVGEQDFIRAQGVKQEMTGLEQEQQRLEEELQVEKEKGEAPGQLPVTCVPDTPVSVEMNEVEMEMDNPAVTLKCLRLLVATLQDPGISQLNATLHTLLEEFVVVSVQSEISSIRKEAILALACCCLRSIDNARQHMLLLLQVAHIDVHEVKIAAISCVIDLLMMHGLASFITSEKSGGGASQGADSANQSESGDTSVHSETASNIESALDSDMATRGATLTQSELESQGGNSVVAILSKMLDEPDLDLRTEVAEGLCKLLMIGSISSPKLISRLLLIWYNPMTESDSKLRHILGTFFPLYASMSRPHQLSLESAFIPTMKILFDAPVTSPLADIDTEDVGMFFVHLTREDMLQSYEDKKQPDVGSAESSSTSVHDSLAFAVCNEILSSPDSFQTKVLIKILTSLQITHNNFVTLRELAVLSEQLLDTVKEKSCVRSLERFDRTIAEWLAKDPSAVQPTTPAGDLKRKSPSKNQLSPGGGSPDKADASQTPKRKRVLFSQSMIGNPLLNLDDGAAGGVGSPGGSFFSPRNTLPSPVVVSQNGGNLEKVTEEVESEAESVTLEEGITEKSSGEEEGGEEDYNASSVEFTNVLASTRIERSLGGGGGSRSSQGSSEESTIHLAASSMEEDEEEAEVSVRPPPKGGRGRGRRSRVSESEAATTTDSQSEEDALSADASSDASSAKVTGARAVVGGRKKAAPSKGSAAAAGKGGEGGESSVDEEVEDETAVRKSRRGNSKIATPKAKVAPKKDKKSAKSSSQSSSSASSVLPATPPPLPPSSRTKRATPAGKGGQKPAEPAAATGRGSRKNVPVESATPPVKTPVSRSAAAAAAAATTPATGGKRSARASTPPRSSASSRAGTPASPVVLSRAGRKNSPRIDYKTGKMLDSDSPALSASVKKNLVLETPSPSKASKRRAPQKSYETSSSSNSSPVLKRKGGVADNGLATSSKNKAGGANSLSPAVGTGKKGGGSASGNLSPAVGTGKKEGGSAAGISPAVRTRVGRAAATKITSSSSDEDGAVMDSTPPPRAATRRSTGSNNVSRTRSTKK